MYSAGKSEKGRFRAKKVFCLFSYNYLKEKGGLRMAALSGSRDAMDPTGTLAD